MYVKEKDKDAPPLKQDILPRFLRPHFCVFLYHIFVFW